MKLTVGQLTEAGAYRKQVNLFRKLFGDEIEVTDELAVAHAHEFDFGCAAEKLLTAPAKEEYERIMAAAWARLYNG